MTQRKFILGDEWLYYKIYCGVSSANTILLEDIKPLVKKLIEEKLIQKWFFIRYSDSEPHIRLRMRLINQQENIGNIISLVKESFVTKIEEGTIWSLQTDTYTREIERYGEQTIESSEEIFYHDSELILNALSEIQNEEDYFIFILKSIESFLKELEFSIDERLKFYQKNRNVYRTEFNIGKKSKISLDKKYRKIRPLIETYLKKNNNDFKEYINVIIDRNNNIELEVKKILQYKNSNALDIAYDDLISSYIHMFVNRAFKSRQRFYELLLYDFLERYTISLIKRNSN